MIAKILVFAFQHKYPIKRSAFTYWENYIPSCIDLGKEKYGGPFTYKQVEDVKTINVETRVPSRNFCLGGNWGS